MGNKYQKVSPKKLNNVPRVFVSLLFPPPPFPLPPSPANPKIGTQTFHVRQDRVSALGFLRHTTHAPHKKPKKIPTLPAPCYNFIIIKNTKEFLHIPLPQSSPAGPYLFGGNVYHLVVARPASHISQRHHHRHLLHFLEAHPSGLES